MMAPSNASSMATISRWCDEGGRIGERRAHPEAALEAGGLANSAESGAQDIQRSFLPIQAAGIPCLTCASMAGPPPAQSAAAIPSFKSGDFNAWFDSQSAGNVAQMYESPALCAKIKAGLRGNGGHHEYLMVAEAPKWKQMGGKRTAGTTGFRSSHRDAQRNRWHG